MGGEKNYGLPNERQSTTMMLLLRCALATAEPTAIDYGALFGALWTAFNELDYNVNAHHFLSS